MSLEQDVFRKRALLYDRLIPYGFVKTDSGYYYEEDFMDGEFRAEVTISGDGTVSGRVMDLDANEEYLPVHIETRIGAYVGEVRQSYTAVLMRIAEACTEERPFLFEQTNRIAGLILEMYGESPDNPFSKYEDIGVFRYPANRKWYGIVMAVKKSAVTGDKSDAPDDSPTVEVLNLKVLPEFKDELLKHPGIYPAYHMSKGNWLSVLLDGTVSDKFIMGLVDISRDFARKGGRGGSGGEITEWIVPANPKYYDVDDAFRKSDEIIWKQSSRVHVGDIVYLYVAAPVSAVRYKCQVLETDIPYDFEDRNVKLRRVMRIRLLKTYDPDFMTFERLRSIGINTVRGPRSAPPEFLKIMENE